MIDRLPPSEERRVLVGLEKAVALSRSGMEPDDAMVKVASDMGFAPELVKRCCEAYNKSKAVHVLSTRPPSTRHEPFSKTSATRVLSRVFGAGVDDGPLEISFTAKEASEARAMTKAASALPEGPVNREQFLKEADELAYRRERRINSGVILGLEHLRQEAGVAKAAMEQALTKAASALKYLNPGERDKALRLMVNKYGDRGVAFGRLMGTRLGVEPKLEKTSSWAVLPSRSPYPEMVDAMDKATRYIDTRGRVERLARGMAKQAGAGRAMLTAAYLGLRRPGGDTSKATTQDEKGSGDDAKEAEARAGSKLGAALGLGVLTVPGAITGGAIAAARQPRDILAGLAAIHGAGDVKSYKDVLDPAFLAQARVIDLKQGFVDAALSKGIAGNYPLADVREAFNNLVGVMPELANPGMRPALVALMKRQLSQNQLMDPAEIHQLIQWREKVGRARPDKQLEITPEGPRPLSREVVNAIHGAPAAAQEEAWKKGREALKGYATAVDKSGKRDGGKGKGDGKGKGKK